MIAVTVGVTITYTLANVLGNSVSLGDPSDSGSIGNIIQYLARWAAHHPVDQELRAARRANPPGGLAPCKTPSPERRSLPDCCCYSVFPSDLVILVTVGINLAQQNASLLGAVPFVAATIFIAALPVLSTCSFAGARSR